MKSEMKNLYQARVDDHPRGGVTYSSATASTGSTRYTCSMYPEIVRDAPGKYPKCGMKLVPIYAIRRSD